ncbi:hypothetical protein [Erythrobacter sp. THAF29]|uniref:hypothetical protein n=1 Tax=Erythrobacter sp. THAF29 TaxID=2587851 RepID=UPI0012688281|nr:hypothetical protein [Erythrobacter sp. THAF29]QFT78224.1 hypothetical protein FIU90_11805 [Erythrobacter sp. THAF29]
MPKTSHLPPISREPNGLNQFEALDHRRAWERHVDAGRIGSGPSTTPEQLARHARNELILCGPRVPRIWED